MLIKCRKLHKGANGFDTFPSVKAYYDTMDGEKQVVIRFLQGLGDGVKLALVRAGVVGLCLTGH